MTAAPVDLAVILENYGAAALKTLESHWCLPQDFAPANKRESFDLLVRHFADAAHQASVERRLKGNDQRVLAESEAAGPLPCGELILRLQCRGLVSAGAAVDRAVRMGVLLALPAVGERVLEFDRDRARRREVIIHPALKGRVVPQKPIDEKLPAVDPSQIVAMSAADPSRLFRVLGVLIGLIRRRKVKVTQDGFLNLTQLRRIDGELRAAGSSLDSFFVIETARAAELVTIAGGILVPGTQAEVALRQPPEVTLRGIFAAFIEHCRWIDDLPSGPVDDVVEALKRPRFDDPPVAAVVRARRVLAGLLGRLRTSDWMDLEAFTARALALAPCLLFDDDRSSWDRRPTDDDKVHDPYKRAVQHELVRCFIARTCFDFGLVELGSMTGKDYRFQRPVRDSQYFGQFQSEYDQRYRRSGPTKPPWQPTPCGVAFRPTELCLRIRSDAEATPIGSRPAGGLVLTPDFEVVADLGRVPADLLLRLGVFAEPAPGHPDDRVRRYRLSPTSIPRALRTGISLESIVEDLETHTGRVLPGNVARTLRDWAAGFGRVELLRDFDLVELDGRPARDRFVAANDGAQAIGESFALVPASMQVAQQGDTRIDYRGQTPASLTVGPTGRIVIDRATADLGILAALPSFAEVASSGTAALLTPASVTRGGLAASTILAILRIHSRSSLPPGIVTAVHGWLGELPAAVRSDLTVVELADIETAAGLLQHAAVRQHALGLAVRPLLLVQPDHAQELVKALAALGVTTEWGLPAVQQGAGGGEDSGEEEPE